jgi:hypothetical protein
MAKKSAIVSQAEIESAVIEMRSEKVLLDADLARFYRVTTKALNQAVSRNRDRFPDDFMFQLSADEAKALRSQIVTLKTGRGQHRKYLPYAFTEQGVAMLSSVLRSPRAVAVNIEIMRAFVRLRKVLAANADLARRLDEVEKHLSKHDEQFVDVIRAIRQLMETPSRPRKRIGFHVSEGAADTAPKGIRGRTRLLHHNSSMRAKRTSRRA